MTSTSDAMAGAVEQRPADPAHRVYVSYIDKSRNYYAAHGYDKPYRWASNNDAPFAPLPKPLSECRVGLVTTSSIHQDDRPVDAPPAFPKRVYAHPTDPAPARMFTQDLSWDKEATTTDDVENFLPIGHLRALAEQGRIGSVANRFYGVPTEYSKTRTARDSEQIEAWCREDGVDVVALFPL